MIRQIIFDTETTGLSPKDSHKIIEIGCVELINRKLTGNNFHYYLNPHREIDPDSIKVHGLTEAFLSNKPSFYNIVDKFLDYINGAELIAHNAAFDLEFLNYELSLLTEKLGKLVKVTDYATVTDTLAIARKLHPGQRNSLDALCKRYSVDNSERELHGALLDSHLLAKVYLAMTGGQGSFEFHDSRETIVGNQKNINHKSNILSKENQNNTVESDGKNRKDGKDYFDNILVIKATEDELRQHQEFLQLIKKKTDSSCLWFDLMKEE